MTQRHMWIDIGVRVRTKFGCGVVIKWVEPLSVVRVRLDGRKLARVFFVDQVEKE